MPTIRSRFNFEQFEEVLQKLAHEIALDAVKSLNQGDVRIVIRGPRFSHVETGKCRIRFFAKHASYEKYGEKGKWSYDGWGFDVEEKFYLTSNHCTKISFWAPEGKEKEVTEKITRVIDKLMADASIKPIPRFTLAKLADSK